MNEENTNLFWERQAGESDEAYRAFGIYRDLRLTRSVKKAAALYYHETLEELSAVTQGERANLLKWSRRWMWVARCEAFDAEEDRERRLRLHERRIKTAEFHYSLGQLALQRVAERLRNLGMDEEIPLRSLAQIMNSGASLQRLALGEPDVVVDLRGGHAKHPEEDAAYGWLNGRSVEEKEEIARLAGLLEDEDLGLDAPAPP